MVLEIDRKKGSSLLDLIDRASRRKEQSKIGSLVPNFAFNCAVFSAEGAAENVWGVRLFATLCPFRNT